MYEYPEKAVREALVNAVCHRDYSRKGSDIKFAIFDDRIEITSPGHLPSSITLDDLGKGISEHRNRVIGRTFSELGLIEGFGTGVFTGSVNNQIFATEPTKLNLQLG